jgi:hypothetical protein
MTVRFYSSLDTGAPALPSVSSQRLIDNLRLIFMACLVNGYDVKPGAGWTMAHDHADGFTLSNGAGYINFVHNAINGVAVYLLESLTDTSAALVTGYNRRSGPWYEGQVETGRHYYRANYFIGTYTNKLWSLVADERTVTFLCHANSSSLDADTSSSAALHFGEYLSPLGTPGFCALGGITSAGVVAYLFTPNIFAGTVLRNPFTGLVDQGGAPGYRASGCRETGSGVVESRPRMVLNRLRPFRASLLGLGAGVALSTQNSKAAYCGLLRGILVEPSLCETLLSAVFPVVGVAAPSLQDKVKILNLSGGRQWVPLYSHTSDQGAFVSLDPADWE